MNADAAAIRLVECIRRAFPDDARAVDARLQRDGFSVGDAPYIWVERFSQRTTNALKRDDFSTFTAHLALLSNLLVDADDATTRCINVAYVESLLWDIKDDRLRRRGWRLIPANLQGHYVALWGKRPFMDRGT